jgi:hypothetical protein
VERFQLQITTLLLALAVAGLLARVVLAWVSEGSNDVDIWRDWATLLRQRSLTDMYSNVAGFNHPPLIAWWSVIALRLGSEGPLRFAILLKVPGLVAEGITSYLLWRIWQPAGRLWAAAAVAAFAWNLDSILVSGFHGSTDSLCAMFCLASAIGIQRRAFFLGGLALAAALNVKLIPLVLVPPLLIQARSERQGLRFLAGLALGALPFLPFLVTAGRGFYAHAIAYGSNPDNWGFGFLFNASEQNPRFADVAAVLARMYRRFGRYLIVGTCVIIGAWGRWRGWSAYRVCFLCLAAFLVLAPGFGVQYTVYVVPVLFAISLRQAMVYSFASGLFILSVYFNFALPGYPLRSQFTSWYPLPTSLFGLLAWVVLIVIALRDFGSPRPVPVSAEARVG